MNIRWKTMAALVVLNALWTGTSSAATYTFGIDYSDVTLNIDGNGGVTYTGKGGTTDTQLDGKNLGNVSSLALGGSIKTHEDTSVPGYATGVGKISSAYLYYSVWSGNPPAPNSFNRIDLSTKTSLGPDSNNGNIQLYEWQATGAGIDLSGLAPGNYTLGIYFKVADDLLGNAAYDPVSSAGDFSYNANFSLVPVPEPTEIALPLFGALCLVGAAVRRSGWWSKRAA